jgi:vacuolar-type H+-ATPase subunit H
MLPDCKPHKQPFLDSAYSTQYSPITIIQDAFPQDFRPSLLSWPEHGHHSVSQLPCKLNKMTLANRLLSHDGKALPRDNADNEPRQIVSSLADVAHSFATGIISDLPTGAAGAASSAVSQALSRASDVVSSAQSVASSVADRGGASSEISSALSEASSAVSSAKEEATSALGSATSDASSAASEATSAAGDAGGAGPATFGDLKASLTMAAVVAGGFVLGFAAL